jgi:putative membrane protein
MRVFDIEALSVETAGQSTPGSLVQLAGIKDGRKFRDAILKQRDLVVGSEEDRRGPTTSDLATASTDDQRALLEDIRDTLRRIESKIAVVNQ